MKHRAVFEPDGSFRLLYDDDTVDVARAVGEITIRRASHVEPHRDGTWYADMGPCGGPLLRSFMTRADALKAERAWLEDHNLPAPTEGS